jgi:hypothetical protein
VNQGFPSQQKQHIRQKTTNDKLLQTHTSKVKDTALSPVREWITQWTHKEFWYDSILQGKKMKTKTLEAQFFIFSLTSLARLLSI